MVDDFYDPPRQVISYPSGLVTKILPDLLRSPESVAISILSALTVILFATRLLSGADSEPRRLDGKDGRTVWRLPHWVPFVGHGFQL